MKQQIVLIAAEDDLFVLTLLRVTSKVSKSPLVSPLKSSSNEFPYTVDGKENIMVSSIQHNIKR